MSNIINQIIEIDAIAQKRLEDAQKISLTMKEEIEAKAEEIKSTIMQKCENRIQNVLAIEKQCADEKIALIKAENEKLIQKLEETYSNSHKQIENDIFQKIITV